MAECLRNVRRALQANEENRPSPSGLQRISDTVPQNLVSLGPGPGGFDRPGVEQQRRQLAQTVIRIRQSAAMGNLWEQLPEGTQLLLQEEMRRQRISHFGYLGQY